MQNEIAMVNYLKREYPQVGGATLDKPELSHELHCVDRQSTVSVFTS